MILVNTYLHFSGNCEEAFDFYKSVFGGEFAMVARYGEMPPMPDMPPMGDADKKKIMHVSLPIGNSSVLMGSDMPPGMTDAIVGTNFSVSVHPDNVEDAERIFNGLAAGGAITQPLEKTFWSTLFGMCKDKYNIHWMVNCAQPPQ